MLNIQSSKLIVLYNALALSFTEEVESLFDFFFVGSLVYAYVAHVAQQCEVDDARRVLLVVVHQFDECRVVVACDVECAVVFAYEACRLMQSFGGEASFACTHIQLANQAEGYSIAMQQRSVLWCR